MHDPGLIGSRARPAARHIAVTLSAVLLFAMIPAASASPLATSGISGEAQAGEGSGAFSLDAELEDLAAQSPGSYGIYVNIPATGEQAGYQEDKPFYAASCYKLFQVMQIYESAASGRIDLEDTITYQAGDVEGEVGVISNMPLGTAFTTRELCRYAIVYSDNVAARMLRRVYGYIPYRDYAASIDCKVSGGYGKNLTTAREMGIILMRVLQFANTHPLGMEVLSYLRDSVTKGRLEAGLPPEVTLADKTGDYQGYNNDAAIISIDGTDCILCVLSSGGSDSLHSGAARLSYDYISGRQYVAAMDGTGPQPAAAQWWFTGGTAAAGLDAWLCLTNPAARAARATLTSLCHGIEGSDLVLRVPPQSMLTVRLDQLPHAGTEVALIVTSDEPLLAQRRCYRQDTNGAIEVLCTSGRQQAATELYLGGGSRGGVLYLANPGGSDASCNLMFMTTSGGSPRSQVVLPAMSGTAVPLNDVLEPGAGLALCILADSPVLAAICADAASPYP